MVKPPPPPPPPKYMTVSEVVGRWGQPAWRSSMDDPFLRELERNKAFQANRNWIMDEFTNPMLPEKSMSQDDDSESKSRFSQKVPKIAWDDIGGLEEAKLHLREAIELPHQHKELFEHYGKKPPKGILLYGPPGCGKTLLGKAAATSLAKIYKSNSVTSGFMYIKGSEISSKWVGETEKSVREIFVEAAKHHKKHGYPAIIFIDEADSIMPNRSTNGSHWINSVVASFLTEMDGMGEPSAIVILATNRAEALDPAIVRDGRVDRKIRISRPTQESATDIIMLNIKKTPIADSKKAKALAIITAEAFFATHRRFYKINTLDGNKYLTLADLINGGMLANVVEYAKSFALRRDIENKSMTGIGEADMLAAVEAIDRENRDIDHKDAIHEFCLGFEKDVAAVTKLAYSDKPLQIAA